MVSVCCGLRDSTGNQMHDANDVTVGDRFRVSLVPGSILLMYRRVSRECNGGLVGKMVAGIYDPERLERRLDYRSVCV